MPHVVQISFFLDPHRRPPAELLSAWSTLVDVAEAVSTQGVRVSVVQASSHIERFDRNGVQYHFLPFEDVSSGLAQKQISTDYRV